MVSAANAIRPRRLAEVILLTEDHGGAGWLRSARHDDGPL
jgi:hypothetical protein